MFARWQHLCLKVKRVEGGGKEFTVQSWRHSNIQTSTVQVSRAGSDSLKRPTVSSEWYPARLHRDRFWNSAQFKNDSAYLWEWCALRCILRGCLLSSAMMSELPFPQQQTSKSEKMDRIMFILRSQLREWLYIQHTVWVKTCVGSVWICFCTVTMLQAEDSSSPYRLWLSVSVCLSAAIYNVCAHMLVCLDCTVLWRQ